MCVCVIGSDTGLQAQIWARLLYERSCLVMLAELGQLCLPTYVKYVDVGQCTHGNNEVGVFVHTGTFYFTFKEKGNLTGVMENYRLKYIFLQLLFYMSFIKLNCTLKTVRN